MSSKTQRAVPGPSIDHEQLLAWVERAAMFFIDEYGVPPITGRIIAWLLVCDPPEQSGAELADAIGASRASITTNIRLLTGASVVRRLTRPGGRTTYYVVDDQMWEAIVRRRVQQSALFRDIAWEGVELLGAGERARRVRAAHDVYAWFADVLAAAPPVTRTTAGRR